MLVSDPCANIQGYTSVEIVDRFRVFLQYDMDDGLNTKAIDAKQSAG